MQVQMETLSNLERQMVITLPISDIESQIDERIKRIAKKAKIAGFRPGKAPFKIVYANYAAEVREEILNEVVNKSFSQALQDKNLNIAGMPQFELFDTLGDSKEFKFKVNFEVYPDIKVGDIDKSTIEIPVLQVTEDEVEKTINILRKQRTSFNYVKRSAADEDRVIINFKGTIDGKEFPGGQSENMPLILGQAQMLSEFEDGVRGLKEGETKSIEVNFPEDYHGKDVAGKKAIFEITVKNVSEPVLPEINSDFAKALGIEDGDVDKMRAEIRKNVEREVKRRLSAKIKENVMKVLLESTSIVDLPKALVSEEIRNLSNEMRQNLDKRGFQSKGIDLPEEGFRKQAERRISLGLIVSELISANKLIASPERVKATIVEHAESYEQPDEVIEWYYSDKKNLAEPTSIALEETVVEFVLSKVKTEEKNISFDELMGTNN